MLREPVAQLGSAYSYWAQGQNAFQGSLRDYALQLGSAEYNPPGFPGQTGPRADWFLGRVKFTMLVPPRSRVPGFNLVDVNPCNQPRGGGCHPLCYSHLNAFLSALDLVIPTDEWETGLLQIAGLLGLTKLPIHMRLTQCLTLHYRSGMKRSAAAAAAAAAGRRRGSASDLRELLLPSVPCSARLYAEWTERYMQHVAARLWADARTREDICTMEAHNSCHLHHGALDEREAAAVGDCADG